MPSEPEHHDVRSIIERLTHCAQAVDKDDLVRLAKMHGWCEEIAALSRPDGQQPDPGLCERVNALAPLLEKAILGETEDPDAAVASIVRSVQAMGHPDAGEPSVDPAKADLTDLTDEKVAGRTAPVFAEEPGHRKDAAEPSADVPRAVEVQGEAPVSPTASSSTLEEPVQPKADTGDPKAPQPEGEPRYQSEPLTIAEKEQEFVKAFLEEAREHLEAIEAALLEVERAPDNTEQIDTLFRPFHTIKGMAGFLNLRDINCLTHEVETLLDGGRKGNRAITPALIDLVFSVVDILRVQISSIGAWFGEPTGDTIPQPPVADMIDHLRSVVAGRTQLECRNPDPGGGAPCVGENLVDQGVCLQEVVDFALEKQKEGGPEQKRIGEILMEMGAATSKQVSQAIRPQVQSRMVGATAAPGQAGAAMTEQSIRIDTAKLDALVDMVGELVIAQTQVSANPQVATDHRLTKDVSQVTKIVRDVQEVAVRMRMIPIGGTFQRMDRLVRDVSRKAGKNVELVISGEETELDKNVIQQINDPLVHMVRNAVDHGIEPADVRRAAGKSEAGRVHLRAFHHGGNIVIEVSDDGKGLDPKVLIAKAVEKGMVSPGEELTEPQAFQLVFAPGFSTAAKVTDISGRGVGLDVVKRNIEQLRGRCEISSKVGQGSTFSVRLPLTLAIIDGMIVRVGTERFIIQTITVEQSLRPTRGQITTVQQKGEILNVRGRLIPLLQLGALFGLTGRIDPCEAMVVIAHSDGGPLGLVVEELIGQQQVVIKSLGERFQRLRGLSGAAILGDGRVGLILEMSGLAAVHDAIREALSTAETVETDTPTDASTPSGGLGSTAELAGRGTAELACCAWAVSR